MPVQISLRRPGADDVAGRLRVVIAAGSGTLFGRKSAAVS